MTYLHALGDPDHAYMVINRVKPPHERPDRPSRVGEGAPTSEPVTSVGSIQPRHAGLAHTQTPAGEGSVAPAPTEPDAEEGDGQRNLLLGFLADYHAALREPPPAAVTSPPAAGRSGTLPSRLAPIAPTERDLLELTDPDAVAAPLPTWPPAPSPSAAAAQEPREASPRGGRRRRFGKRS